MVCRNLSAFADAPRAGSAEAKTRMVLLMQSDRRDAPRAGSAEAKICQLFSTALIIRCTPCRQRRGKAGLKSRGLHILRCTPCRQRRGKAGYLQLVAGQLRDAPRAGSAEAKRGKISWSGWGTRCTPCRQRRGKGPQREL